MCIHYMVAMPNEFQTFEDKSSAINADTGVNKRLADMIYKWHLPGMKLAVGKPEYKTIIESNLGMPCLHNAIVMEIMWGIQHLMHKLVPEEKAEVAKDDRFPMSQGLKMLLSRYGFDDVKPETVNEEIVATASALFDCDAVYKKHFEYLGNASLCFEKVSGINTERWGALKLATALKVVCCPEEDDFHEVLSENELLKLKEEAPNYKDLVSNVYCMRAYERISHAHQVRAGKKRLLGFLVKEAKAACEKGNLHGESGQIPQEHVMSASLCRMILPMTSALERPYVHELLLPKDLKKFCEGLPLGQGSIRSSFSGAQPSTSKAIVPYEPTICHVLQAESQSQNVDIGNMDRDQCISLAKSTLSRLNIDVGNTVLVEVEIEATSLASVGVKDEVKLKQVQVQANGGSGLPPGRRKSVSNPSPFDGKVLRRSARLKRDSTYVSSQEGTRKRHCLLVGGNRSYEYCP